MPRRHHLLPRFYLKRFAKGDQLTAVRRDTGKTIIMSTRDASVRTDFYTVEGLGEQKAYAVENFLSQFENDAASVIQRMTNLGGFPLSEVDRTAMAAFMAFQFVRGKMFRDSNEDSAEHITKIAVCMSRPEALIQKIASDLEREPTQTEVNDYVRAMKPAELGVRVSRNEHIRNMLTAMPQVLPLLVERNWQLVRFHVPTLLTCDQPVAVFWGDEHHLSRAAMVCFPLDPQHLLTLSDKPDGKMFEGKLEDAKKINKLVAFQAYEWIFHRPTHTPLGGIQLQARPPMVRSGLGSMPTRQRR